MNLNDKVRDTGMDHLDKRILYRPVFVGLYYCRSMFTVVGSTWHCFGTIFTYFKQLTWCESWDFHGEVSSPGLLGCDSV